LIPVFGFPILNKPHLMQAMLDTVDHPIDRIYVVDNGGVVVPDAVKWPWDTNRIHVADLGYNAGVAASWNMIIRANIEADWWMIACNDVLLEPGSLARVVESMATDKPTLSRLVMGNEASWGNHFGVFALNAQFIEKVGWFDENFIPIFWEDTDYIMRIEAQKSAGYDLNLPVIPSSTHHEGNQSWKTGQSLDPVLAPQNSVSWDGNVAYFTRKKEAIDMDEASVVHWRQPSIERIRAQDWRIPWRDNVKDGYTTLGRDQG